jgi:hypothetical protein
MLCKYETPMAVTGVPEGTRNSRFLLGKRLGHFELREYAPGGIVNAGCLVRPRQTHDTKTYYAAVDGSGLFSDLGTLRGAFAVDSTIPAVDDALRALQLRINNYDKADIRKHWYPPALALQMLGYLRPAARQFRDFDLDRERMSDFDMGASNKQHDELGARLVATCVACEDRVFNVEPMPFIAVSLTDKEVTVSAEICDVCDYLTYSTRCVKLFGINEYEAALSFAQELAVRTDQGIGGYPFEFAGSYPQYFAPSMETWQCRVVSQHLAATFKAFVGKMGALSVATEMPYEALAIARPLLAALSDPLWTSKLEILEEASNAAIDYDDAEGTGYFVNRQNLAHVAVVELWRDRVVDVGFLASRPTP